MRLGLLLIIFFTSLTCMAQDLTKVEVEQGIVQGIRENNLVVFKGIPFAAPPVDDLRWKAPQPPSKWEGIKKAHKYAPSPYQPGENPDMSEDCLYLNIWSPAKTKEENLPVMVWIYGGGFSFGTTAGSVTDGTNLAKEGVIVVSIAYRVGQLGFLAHPELSAENEANASGNYGLLDQIAGLKWIKKNIAQFGGDPDKITIFGESAGGISVSMLCASPLAKGLFSGAISQSGGSFGPTRPVTYPGENMKTLSQAEEHGKSYLNNTEASTIDELRKIAPDSLPLGMNAGGAWPIIDGYVIPEDQYELYKKGDYNDVSVLIGYNSDEGLSFTRENSSEKFIENVKNRYKKFSDTLLKAYPVEKDRIPKSARDLNRDAAFGWHTWTWARLQSRTGNSKVFYYYFDQHPDYPKDSPKYGHGSPHGQDVAYAFMTLDKTNSEELTESDYKLSGLMGTYWTNFAKSGNPNGKNIPQWPEFTDTNPKVMYLNNDPQAGPVPDEKSMKVLDSYFQWRFTAEGDLKD